MTSLSIPDQGRIIALFEKRETLDSMIDVIRKDVKEFKSDTSTKKGRAEITSFAHRIAKIKVAIDNAGKDMTQGMKDKCKVIDAERKHMRDSLAELQEEAKSALTKYEAEQAVKQEKINRLYDIFSDAHADATRWSEYTSKQMDDLITKLIDVPIDRSLFETNEDYEKINGDHGLAAEKLGIALIQIKHKESADAELAQLRKEKLEREAADAKRVEDERLAKVEKDRQERIKADKDAAVLKAKADAEKAAEDARIETDRKAKQDKADQLRTDEINADIAQKKIDQANADREASEKREQDAKDQVDLLNKERDEFHAAQKKQSEDEANLRSDWHAAICMELSNMALTDVADGIINGDFTIAKMIAE